MLNSWRRLALAVAIAASAGWAVALAVTVPGGSGGTAKVPVNDVALIPNYSPKAGQTDQFILIYRLKKSMPLTVKYVKPAGVTKVTASPKPTKWVHGDPVWKYKKLCACARPHIKLFLTFAKSLKTGQRVKEKFVFSSRGYLPVTKVIVQQIYNP